MGKKVLLPHKIVIIITISCSEREGLKIWERTCMKCEDAFGVWNAFITKLCALL
jgi:hypothetical protein